MRIQAATRTITAILVPLAVVATTSTMLQRHYREEQARAQEIEQEALLAAYQLRAGSDRLTAAVRAYAATGDREFRDAFERELTVDRSRDKAVERLKALGVPPEDLALVERAKRNSDQLITLENQAFAAAAAGDLKTAIALVHGEGYRRAKVSIVDPLEEFGRRLEAHLDARVRHTRGTARLFGSLAVASVASTALALLTALVFFRRRVVTPLAVLKGEIDQLLAGEKGVEIGFQADTSEVGDIARSLESLRSAADEVERQRWIKSSVARLTGDLQGAPSLAAFGQRLLSGLLPMLGGGVAAFYVLEEKAGRVRRVAAFALADDAASTDSFALGEGLVGQCARDRVPVTLVDLPPEYLRVASALGGAAPARAMALPLLSRDGLLGVLEIASLRALTELEELLLEELLPGVGMSLEIVQRNVHTQELLGRTQEQARLLEEQTGELTRQQDETLTQQRELTTQREQLQASEERSRLILDASAEGIFGVDTEGRITFVNVAACRLLGFSAEDLVGQGSHAAIHHHRPDGTPYPKEECPMFAAYTRGEASRVDDEYLWRQDGAGLPVEYGATPLVKDGAVVGAVVTFIDITHRRVAEEAILDHSALLRAVIDTIPNPLFAKDPDTRFLDVNRAYEEAFGVRREDLIGTRVVDGPHLAEEDRLAFQTEDEAVVASVGAVRREVSLTFADGKVHDTLYFVSGFRKADGAPGGLVGSFVDVSDRKEAE